MTDEIYFENKIVVLRLAVECRRNNMVLHCTARAETMAARASVEEQCKASMRQMAGVFEAAVGGIIGLVASSATELRATAETMTATAVKSTTVAAAAEEASTNVNLR